jgi:hypothetical protein
MIDAFEWAVATFVLVLFAVLGFAYAMGWMDE